MNSIRNLLFASVLLLFDAVAIAQTPLNKGDIAPDFSMVTAGGEQLVLSKIDADLILLDFWAGWCGPCIKTIDETLMPLHQAYSEDQLTIIGVSYDKTEAKWKKAIKRFRLPWKQVYDGSVHDLYRKYSIELIPTYYLIDREGKIVASNLRSSELSEAVASYLGD